MLDISFLIHLVHIRLHLNAAWLLRHNIGLPKMRVVSGSFSLFHWLNNRREDPWIHSHRYTYTHFNDQPFVTDSHPKAFREIGRWKKSTAKTRANRKFNALVNAPIGISINCYYTYYVRYYKSYINIFCKSSFLIKKKMFPKALKITYLFKI